MTQPKNITRYRTRLTAAATRLRKDARFLWLKKLARPGSVSVYLVGGAVRDLALGRPSVDYDFVVTGLPPKQLEARLRRLGQVDLVGKTFGVYKFTPKNAADPQPFDIALPRTEHSFKTGGYKDVAVTSDHKLGIESDLERRDFTINAMALRLEYGIQKTGYRIQDTGIVDPFNGLGDLDKKIIRCVGKPQERFKEDYSRMLRALRFSVQLDFVIEKNTSAQIKKNIPRLSAANGDSFVVPRETIAKELVKMMRLDPVRTFSLLDEYGVFKTLMPEVLKMKKCPQPKKYHAEGDVWKHTALVLKNLYSPAWRNQFFPRAKKTRARVPDEVAWAALFHDTGKPYTLTRSDRLRFNGHDVKSAKLFDDVAGRLGLSSAGLDAEKTRTVIARHMFLTMGNIAEMKETTLEKYFFNPRFPGRELLMLSFADVAATVPPSGRPDFTHYRQLTKRLSQLSKKVYKNQKRRVPELLDGHAIMQILGLPPGPAVGKIKDQLRELQLTSAIHTPAQARAALLKKYSPQKPL